MGQKGSLEYIWAPVGSRPLAVRDNRHDSVYLFGALCPDRADRRRHHHAGGQQRGHERAPSTKSVHRSRPARTAVLVCDGAGWHQRGGKLVVPGEHLVVAHTAYSPELNPMENVWDYLRGNKLSHRVGTATTPWSPLRGSMALPDERPRPDPINRSSTLGMCQWLSGLVLHACVASSMRAGRNGALHAEQIGTALRARLAGFRWT